MIPDIFKSFAVVHLRLRKKWLAANLCFESLEIPFSWIRKLGGLLSEKSIYVPVYVNKSYRVRYHTQTALNLSRPNLSIWCAEKGIPLE